MSVRSEREKSKMQEKYQVILAQMLKEDDNRFCVDCDTKSPRWASWNLGIFICIRCAGFHRNLGVHISKVKSVNLDSWTADQIASMQAMGNNKARAVYEANLPPGFRRPQADAALEAFIRAKYEQRKWIAKDWIPPEIKVSSDLIESETNTRRMETASDLGQVEKPTSNNIPKIKPIVTPTLTANPVRQQATSDRPTSATQPSSLTTSISTPIPPVVIDNPPDLLGLDEPVLPMPTNTSSFPSTSTKTSTTEVNPLHELFTSPIINTNETKPTLTNFEHELQNAFSSSNETNSSTNSTNLLTNDKIMALYKTPQTSSATSSGMNIRPASMQPSNVNSSGFVNSSMQPPHLLSHQKSASFGSNLYQQTVNHFPSQPVFPVQQGFQSPIRPGMPTAFYQNPNNLSTPTLQNPSSTFTHEQLNNQFSQFVPFANSKTNTSASALISGMPTRPVTDRMPASSDLLWQ